MRLSIIAAVAANGVIGRDNQLPWHLSEDLRRFKRLTMGHHLILGRKTFESIGRPLPGRSMVVVSRRRPVLAEGVRLADSLQTAIDLADRAGDDEAFVAGGAEIYAMALPLADRLYLTRIEADFEGDTRFPDLDFAEWRIRSEEPHSASADFEWPFRFQMLERVSRSAPGKDQTRTHATT